MPSSSATSIEEIEDQSTESVSSIESADEETTVPADTIRQLCPELAWDVRPKLEKARRELKAAESYAICDGDDRWQKEVEGEERAILNQILSSITKLAVAAARDPECSADDRGAYIATGEWCVAVAKTGLSENERSQLVRIWNLW